MPKTTHIDRLQAVSQWVEEALPVLGLTGWRVIVSKAPSSQDAWAEIEPHSQSQEAELFVAWDLGKQAPEKVREVLTHELVHLITARSDRMVDALEDSLGKLAWSVFEPQWEDATERTVDHIARLLAPGLPLPKLTKEGL
jgi:hypothetical protein